MFIVHSFCGVAMTDILRGSPVAEGIDSFLRSRIAGKGITLVAVVSTDDPSMMSYLRSKRKKASSLGISFREIHLPEDIDTDGFISCIEKLNADPEVSSIIVEEPVPRGVDFSYIRGVISPLKDVDCVSYDNLGRLFSGSPRFVPATVLAVLKILDYYRIPVSGREVLVVGRSLTVGKPLASMLSIRGGDLGDATVTLAHSKSRNLNILLSRADVVISAVGKPHLVTGEHIKEGSVVIDVGTNYVDGRLTGDVDTESVVGKASAVTPVPGGVGVVTSSAIFLNAYYSYCLLSGGSDGFRAEDKPF